LHASSGFYAVFSVALSNRNITREQRKKTARARKKKEVVRHGKAKEHVLSLPEPYLSYAFFAPRFSA